MCKFVSLILHFVKKSKSSLKECMILKLVFIDSVKSLITD